MFDLILLYVAKVTAILLAFITIAEKVQNMAYKKQEKRSKRKRSATNQKRKRKKR
ncbi:hypothetical protein SAMN05421503_1451 [Terribacillus aidingensis]|uniref:Uncharacterized protein n=1 Tax=Terribacillus aidingensis TaxID=586416 RepID=A0A285NQ59_9BACI|nr:hypothetical protein [Terribacillus aidingensis]SNZ09986.1 hypothetical protein SAMN05421503_1451 [Terribacillus aidingensis]